MEETSNPIILYDGVCALCNSLVRFVLRHDRNDRFRFAALQSELAKETLCRHGLNSDSLDTVYLVLNYKQPSEHLLARNDAVTAVLHQLGGSWRIAEKLLGLFPSAFRVWRYNLIARNRYRVFGKYDSCPLPEPEDRHKFVDLG